MDCGFNAETVLVVFQKGPIPKEKNKGPIPKEKKQLKERVLFVLEKSQKGPIPKEFYFTRDRFPKSVVFIVWISKFYLK